MEDSREKAIKRITKTILNASIAAALVVSPESVNSQSNPRKNGVEKYGKVLLYNATESEGGTSGYGGVVQDPQTGTVFLCSVNHVTEGGDLMKDIFTPKGDGDDPVVCTEINPSLVGINPGEIKEDIPKISTEPLNIGDTLSMVDTERGIVEFKVTEIEEGKVWFTPKSEDSNDWVPSRGQSGSLVVKVEDESASAVGFFAGERIESNRDNPSSPLVTFFMAPFDKDYFE